ncbi:MAG: restriction endonuclease [Defluviitaleaceae bacterium]|nr:restriction endonuclease [Defluviitaleaceae bacterium]
MVDEFKTYTPQEMYEYCVHNYFGTGDNKKWSIRHFEVLCKNFNQNENIPMIFIGLFEKVGTHCAFAVTSKKILIGRKKMIGDYFYSILSNRINNVTLEKGGLLAFGRKVVIHTKHEQFKIWFAEKNHAENVAEELKSIYNRSEVMDRGSVSLEEKTSSDRNAYDTPKQNTMFLTTPSHLTVFDVDNMNGTEFEILISVLFEKMGYLTEITKKSGDQGIDVIARNDILSIGIQAKCYSGTVSNSAIQEVVAGLRFHKCDKGMVITNRHFTKSARELAEANNISIWDRDLLTSKLEELKIYQSNEI